ncbi:MAG TPA: GDSL-type esterase/lipase family protein [Clostridia bacterium]|nr:GDSL-type esterase/lipase family protein [Clostridia bacterium]
MNKISKVAGSLSVLWMACVLTTLHAFGAELAAPPSAKRILFLGDSITYSGLYVEYFETFLRMQYPEWQGTIFNLGLPSETVSGLSEEGHANGEFPRPDLNERLDRVLGQVKPDLVLACYGINDGIYQPFDQERFWRFQEGIQRLREKVAAAGAQMIHLTPPTYDPAAGKSQAPSGPNYNEVLDRYSDWLLSKRADGWTVLDIHSPMNRHLSEHRQKDPAYRLAGDGVHPGEIGHWVMARPLVVYFGGPEALGSAESAKPMLEGHPHGAEILKLVGQRQRIMKDAWLTDTGHRRPGMNKGLPLDEAKRQTAGLEAQIRELAALLPVPKIDRDSDGKVTISCVSTNVVIRYTLNATTPEFEAGPYLAPIEFPYSGTVKAAAYYPGSTYHGPVAAATFTALAGVTGARPHSAVLPITQNRDWRVYDWASRHASVCQLVRERKPKLVFIGDSITHFFGGEPVGSVVRGKSVWEKFYARRNALNLGFGWDRTENVLWRLKHGELDGASPKAVVVLIGTNNLDGNSPQEIADGVEAICRELHARLPATRILLLGLLPRSQKPDERRSKLAKVNSIIAKLDGRDGVSFLDIGKKFFSEDGTIPADVMDDYLHPTAKGYEIFAEAIEPTLAKLLGETSESK